MSETCSQLSKAFHDHQISPEKLNEVAKYLFCYALLGLRPGQEACQKVRFEAKLPRVGDEYLIVRNQFPKICLECKKLEEAASSLLP